MRVIFLDFDGVLNSVKYDRERDKTINTNIDESRLPLLKQIVDATQAKIVLSTSWRRHWNKNVSDCDDVGLGINTLFKKYGMEIYGKTPQLHLGAGRKAEVLSWLEFPPETVESFVILDDYALGWEELGERLVKTSPYIGRGLETEHVEKAINILKNDKIRGAKSMERYPVERFIEAQERNYAQAIAELRNEQKTSHWMWYVFPQLRFLGHSDTAYYYGIADEEEAKEYCANAILYDRYIECCRALESVQDTNPERVMGSIDALKLCSSLTLFYMVDEKNKALYEKLINKFYHGRWDRSTIDYLVRRRIVDMRLNEEPFQQIKNGEKTIEVRLYDEKRRKIQVGNRICFTHTENKEKQIQARVVALHCFDTFKELFENVGLDSCGFKGYSEDEAVECMRKYYSSEEERKYGVVGIEIIKECI